MDNFYEMKKISFAPKNSFHRLFSIFRFHQISSLTRNGCSLSIFICICMFVYAYLQGMRLELDYKKQNINSHFNCISHFLRTTLHYFAIHSNFNLIIQSLKFFHRTYTEIPLLFYNQPPSASTSTFTGS